MALVRAQKVENDAPARLLLFCSPLLLLPALPVPEAGPWAVAVVFFSTRLVLRRDGWTCTFEAKSPDGVCKRRSVLSERKSKKAERWSSRFLPAKSPWWTG